MMTYKKTWRAALMTGAVITTLALPFAAKAETKNLTDAQKSEIQAVIKEYLLDNPEVVVEALDAYRNKQEIEQREQAKANISKHMDYFKSDKVAVAGNPEGKIQVVEFFDYNCGYCKKAYPDVVALIEDNKDVRVVFQEMPILGPTSVDAAKWAEAARIQGKYFEFHKALMESNKPKTVEVFGEISKDLGLDIEKMKTDANSTEVMEIIGKSAEVARDIGVTGTPAFIIGEEFYPGYLGENGLKNAVEEASKPKAE